MGDAPPQAPKRFQFSSFDLLLISVITFIGLALFLLRDRMINFAGIECRVLSGDYISSRDRAIIAAVVVAASIIGGIIGIAVSHQDQRLRRTISMGVCVGIAWLSVGVYLRHYKFFNGNNFDPSSIRMFLEAEELYHRDHHEFAKSLRELGPLLPEEIRNAEAVDGKATAFHGYVFKVLKAQGPGACYSNSSQRLDYIIKDEMGSEHMTLGYAIVASPVLYGVTGFDTYISSGSCVSIFFKDLGANTESRFKNMTEYDPELNLPSTWYMPP